MRFLKKTSLKHFNKFFGPENDGQEDSSEGGETVGPLTLAFTSDSLTRQR